MNAATAGAARNGTASTWQIRIGGVGGQGIVLASKLLGVAASLYDGKEAVCTQVYGPEARGGAARSDVVISEEPVDYPFVTEADVLAVLFPEAYSKFRPRLRPGGLLIVDSQLVKAADDEENIIRIPATKIADAVGNRMARNVVILGCLIGSTGVVSREAMVEAIRNNMKPKIVELNIRALDAGIRFAETGELP
ncbi:MAG: pyruvate ferredoxin oxidoreductase [Xanthomonadales bacterium]|nr:pyruvate ferredoxin oxidoreductase [Xanthomonadales bacterium]NIN60055.1 pyruvate ferredoxin oxidoreductase [Xanthomonadales bacterium]NIN75423.1 pyruvate ferredoxin oxidoreductase [Xanthomonadales bacterium]NIO14246.1 pyruvate ferredoxin oxidoreductase [Xanthomonadales bacterium]NIP12448.1 pyruvate ferredoxin oxidoreductase [Xanthomonadales bacterium]